MKFEPIQITVSHKKAKCYISTKQNSVSGRNKGSFINMEPNDLENHKTVNHILSKYDNIKNVSSLPPHPNSLAPLKQT